MKAFKAVTGAGSKSAGNTPQPSPNPDPRKKSLKPVAEASEEGGSMETAGEEVNLEGDGAKQPPWKSVNIDRPSGRFVVRCFSPAEREREGIGELFMTSEALFTCISPPPNQASRSILPTSP